MDIDVWREVGIDAMAQVDIGERRQPHQPLQELGAMADDDPRRRLCTPARARAVLDRRRARHSGAPTASVECG